MSWTGKHYPSFIGAGRFRGMDEDEEREFVADLHGRYWNDAHTLAEIAADVRTTREAVSLLFRRYGLPIRGRGYHSQARRIRPASGSSAT